MRSTHAIAILEETVEKTVKPVDNSSESGGKPSHNFVDKCRNNGIIRQIWWKDLV